MTKQENILVVGVARSGLAAGKLALSKGACVTFNDAKNKESLSIDDFQSYKGAKWDLGGLPKDIEKYDCVILSPGVPTDLSFIKDAKEKGIQVIGALEYGYIHSKGTFYGITGTNGKTTTTQLTYEIFKAAGKDTYAVGNIGQAVSSVSLKSQEDTCLITEVSSFQLESIDTFRPHIAAILNLTPDHLNRHGNMENYESAKKRIYENQRENDFLVLNYDDLILRNIKDTGKGQVFYFSKRPLDRGFYIKNQSIICHIDQAVKIMEIKEIKVLGDHNLENILAAVAIAYLAGIEPEVIKKAVANFKGVEHRIEYVGTFYDVACYNDSKATNPEAAQVAIKSMKNKGVLIAGGMDKGSDFEALSDLYCDHLSHLVLLGETKEQMKMAAYQAGFYTVTLVDTMAEAVSKAFELAKPGSSILLSPACASWDMYESYEVRGKDFKTCIEKVRL